MTLFSTRLKELRKRHGISQLKLAESIGVTKGTVSVWERGGNVPEYRTTEKLAEFFDVPLAYLLGFSEDSNPTSNPAAEGGSLYEIKDKEFTDLTKLLAELSPESRKIIAAAISAAYELDKERGMLRSMKMSSNVLELKKRMV